MKTTHWNTQRGIRSTRRRAAGTALLLATAPSVLTAACAGAGQATGGDAAKPIDLKGTTVEYWTWNPAAHPESVAKEKLMADFGAKNPHGVNVTLGAPAGGGAAAYEKIVAAMTAGTPPDMVDGWHFYMSDLFRQGATVDIDAELKGDNDWKRARPAIYPNVLEGLTWKGKLFGIPINSSHFGMYYSPNFLKRASLVAPPPKGWSWDQFTDYARKASQPPDVTGYDDQWSYSRTGMMALANGHRFMNKEGTKFSYNSPEALEAVEFQMTLIKQGLMRAHDGSANGGYSEKLPGGKVVFQFGVAARVPDWRRRGIDFGTCYYPIGPKNRERVSATHGEAYCFAVFKNKDARKQAAAFQAALWVTRPASGLVMAREGATPPSYKSTIEDASFQAEFKKDAELWPFYDLISGFVPMPNFPGFGEVRIALDKKILEIWAGTVSVRDGLAEATRLGQQRLDEALK